MRIAVLVKQIPNPEAAQSFEAGRLVRGGDEMLNELDENAIEAALQLRDAAGGEVLALTMGPESGQMAVRRALQLGADAAYHVCDEAAAGSDAIGTARVLAAAVRHLGAEAPVDLVLAGLSALDGRTSLVPAALSALLEWDAVTGCRSIAVSDGKLIVERAIDDAVERHEVPLPAVISVTDQANTPRFPGVKGIMAAKKKPVTTLTLAELGVEPASVGEAGAGSRVLTAGQAPTRGETRLFAPTEEGVAQLVDYLIDNRIITEVRP